MSTLWSNDDPHAWSEALSTYRTIVAAQGVSRLTELDQWYREEFPRQIAARTSHHITHQELIQVTEWKMKRGVWRARNLVLVRGNDPDEVIRLSTEGFALLPDARKPLARIAQLAGVGPATASAVLAAVRPEIYPFFDELIADQIPGLGKVAFTPGYYARYAEQLRERAKMLSTADMPWTAHAMGQALWAAAGGKAA